jgi:hypothetical protein
MTLRRSRASVTIPAGTMQRPVRLAYPHRQASEVTFADMPGQPGVSAFREAVVTTACGIEITTTLTTRSDDRVRCPDCLTAMVTDAGQ